METDNKQIARDDLKMLEKCGVTLTKLDEGLRTERWAITESIRDLGIPIGLDERLALLFGRELVLGALQETDVGDRMDELAHHISALEHSQLSETDFARRFYCRHEPKKSYANFREELRTIVSCLISSRRLSFEYTKPGASSDLKKHIRPLTLLMYKRGLYLMGYKPGADNEERLYAVERMKGVVAEDITFDYPTPGQYDPRESFKQTYGIWSGDEPAEVVLRFEGRDRAYVKDRRWMEGQTVTMLPNGRCELRFVATGNELVSLVTSFGAAVEVVEPPWLRKKVIQTLKGALARYT